MHPSPEIVRPRGRPTGTLGVYVHVPFCVRHCPYCDFAVTVVRSIPHRDYGDALVAELDERGWQLGGRALRSVYFGGGTPGLWDPSELARVLGHIVARFGRRWLREVTIELNPDRVDRAMLDAWRRAGVTRVSLGVQSFDDHALQTLGRAHDAARAERAVRDVADAGFERISVDLIHGVPGTTIETSARDIDRVGALGVVDHLSLYELTWEPGTGFDVRRRRGQLSPWPDEQLETAWFELGDALRAHGFERYEVSSWARPGHRAVHNAGYWYGDEYLGLGVGAHSMRWAPDGSAVVRRANGRSTRAYLAGTSGGQRELVSRVEHGRECVATGLRTSAGVDVQALCDRLGLDPGPWSAAARVWAEQGYGRWDGARFAPDDRGLALADSLAATLY